MKIVLLVCLYNNKRVIKTLFRKWNIKTPYERTSNIQNKTGDRNYVISSMVGLNVSRSIIRYCFNAHEFAKRPSDVFKCVQSEMNKC